MKNYWKETQKGKTIQIMILKWNKEYTFEDLIQYKTFFTNIFIWAKVWSRLSELLADWIVTVEYFENPNKYNWFLGFHRAKYKLTDEAFTYYKNLYFNK